MRIAWFSNAPWAQTGYGNQTKVFAPRLKAAGHEVAIIAFYGLEGAILNWQGIPIYPRAWHPYGQDVMSAHAQHFKADILLSLMDAWVVEPRLLLGGVRWVPWFPIDHDPLQPPVRDRVAQSFSRIVFSRFGERLVREAGLDCDYVPHGVETKVFRPGDRQQARQTTKLPSDAYVVGMVAANKGNPSRKAFPQQLAAFAEFHRRHPDSILYLHTIKGENGEGQGVNLPELCRHLGLVVDKDIVFADQYSLVLGAFSDADMATIYNALDVLLSVSMGEGFGIPILEAQSCGTPVIVGDWTAMAEICFSGWKIDKADADKHWSPLGAYQWVPRVGAIVDALEEAHRCARNPNRNQWARDGALAYDADRVVDKYWQPVLAALDERVSITHRLAETVRANWMNRA